MSDMASSAQKILLVTSGSTGNNVFCTPAIRLLRKHLPEATIDVVALNKLSAEVFENNPDINQLFVIKNSSGLDRIAKNYTTILLLNNSALKKLRGLKAPYLLIPTMNPEVHHADQVMQFVANWLGVAVVEDDRKYVIETQQSAEKLLANYALSDTDVLINIHLGCGTTVLHGWKFFYSRRADDKKLWSIEAYIALGKKLHALIPNLKISITGTSNESFLAKKFEKQVGGTINLVGKTKVSDLVALMQRANLFIAHDCGVFHIAAATNVPIVGLYGPTNHVLTGPYPIKPQHIVIKKAEMTDISEQDVTEAACELLKKFPRK
ncbi:MAG TPA: glycosyltransferase family 9 protein [Methylotenera sp.]|jgi:ADP-heptose:LPS heptosyltransferase|nr:glycosyltransferase family 9 protein [Methylotenera sp.]HQS44537.1 glycosyltransferase family 9 protein [Methylotenera sp.]